VCVGVGEVGVCGGGVCVGGGVFVAKGGGGVAAHLVGRAEVHEGGVSGHT
jgi:hypothetical protein